MAVKTIIEKVDNCVGCPPELGCAGRSCPNHPKTVTRKAVVCDACGREIRFDAGEKLCRAPYQKEPAYICEDCLEERLKWFGIEEFLSGTVCEDAKKE